MLATTEGIILHSVKYGESSLIVAIYTKDFGRQSFIINAARSKKATNKAGIFQPLFLVDLVTYQKQSREIQRIREVRNNPAYQDIPFNINKSVQAIFLAEILSKTLQEEESAPELFGFLKNAFLYFDLMENGITNFHLFMLQKLSGYLGFMPNIRNRGFENWFDIKKGEVVAFEPLHPYYIKKDASAAFFELAQLSLADLQSWRISAKMREYLLGKLIDYYKLHFQQIGNIKSLRVLKEVFE